ncbi:RHS repeat protein [Alicyclobacillaceae bacterium I2511]|nr:RHS repeat protein [Alicyclobacillaceae bacterium I2511]
MSLKGYISVLVALSTLLGLTTPTEAEVNVPLTRTSGNDVHTANSISFPPKFGSLSQPSNPTNPRASKTSMDKLKVIHFSNSSLASNPVRFSSPIGKGVKKVSTPSTTPIYETHFASESGNGPLVSYKNGLNQIQFTLQNAKQVPVSLTSDGVKYAGILPGVDVVYTTGKNGIKEGIVLHNNKTQTQFTFTVQTSHLMVRYVKSQGIILYDKQTHKPVAMIPNPVVTDANGVQSKTAASMTAYPIANGDFVVNIEVNSSWLHSLKRAFPITIDPSIVNVNGPAWAPSSSSSPTSGSDTTGNRADYSELNLPSPSSTPQELLGLRTANSQTFLNPNGTFTTDVYTTPQFYKDETGHWQSIDNSLVQGTDANFPYHNAANGFEVAFAGKAQSSNMMQFSVDGDSIDMGLNHATNVSSTVQGNGISFTGALNNTNLSYDMLPDGVKESIILNSASAPNSESFTLNLQGLSYVQNNDGSITFTDIHTGKPVAYIPAPYMFDANHVTSQAVTQSITNNGNGTATLTITADSSWLQQAGRVFPVTIDPTIQTGSPSQATQAAFVVSNYPNSNYSGTTLADVGTSSVNGTMNTLYQFEQLPALLPGATGATIQSATFEAYQNYSGENGMGISAEPITSGWPPTSVTWSTQPSYGSATDTQTQATSNVSSSSPYVGTWNFNVTSLVKQWYSEQADNYGIALVGGTSSYAQFGTNLNTGANEQPVLSITYSVQPVGTASFWTQTADGVNVSDGNLELSQTDLNTPGRGYPLTVTRTYNSLTNQSSAPGHTNLFGNGWTSNLDMSIANWGHGPIVFTDANGRQHFFIPNGNGSYIVSDAEHLSLTISSSGYTVTEQDGTQIQFNASRKLTRISVPIVNGGYNITTFGYNSSGQLSTITDPSGRVMSVTLNSNGQIASITDPAGRVASYTYSNGNLTGVTIAAESGSTDTTTTGYGYNSSNQLTSVTDPNGVTTSYGYSGNEISSVTSPITVNGSVVNASDTYTTGTSNGYPTMTVTDPNGHEVMYTTNASGNVTEEQVDPTGLNLKTVYTWDQNDQLKQVEDPNLNTTSYQYDNGTGTTGNSLPIQATDAMGNNQYLSYNSNSQLTGNDNNNAGISGNRYNSTELTDSVNSLGKNQMTDYNQYGMPTEVSPPVSLGQNLIPNSSFEVTQSNGLPAEWTNTSSGTGGSATDTTTQSEFGTHSLELQAATSTSGDEAVEMSEYVPVQPNGSYNLSTWLKTVGVDGTPNGGSPVGAVINMHWYQNNTGTPSATPGTNYLDNMLGTNGWTRETAEITAPSDANYVLINVVLYGTTGTAYWDGIQLEPLSGAGTNNSILNQSFTNNPPSATLPVDWGSVTSAPATVKMDTSATGSHNGMASMLLGGATSQGNQLYQYINLPQYAWNGLILSGWSKEENATGSSESTTPEYDLKLYATYADGNTQNIRASNLYFPTGTNDVWNQVEAPFSLSQLKDSNGELPSTLEVYVDYNYETGQAWFNGLQARFLAASSSASDYNVLEDPGFEYDYTQANGSNWPDYWNTAVGSGSASWESTDVHSGQKALELVPESSSVSGATTETVSDQMNDSFGNHNFTLIGYIHTHNMSGNDAYIRLDALDANGNVLQSFDSQKIGYTNQNSAGDVPWTRVDVVVPASEFPTHTASVQVTLAVDPDANGSNAAAYFDDILLDESNLFTSYSYDANNNYTTQITDQLGHTVQIGYGNDNTSGGFSTNFTGENTGDPNQITDPNGNNSYYSYNKMDQVVGYTYTAQVNGSTVYPTFNYTYDQNGNLKSIQDPNGNQVAYQYNQLNEPTQQTETVNGTALNTMENYNAGGLLTGIQDPNGTSMSLGYDNANRITSVTDKSATTTDTFGYSYDNNGNLLKATQNGSTVYNDGYNANNELTSVTAPYSSTVNNTENFTLDPLGNTKQVAYDVGGTTWNETNQFNIGSQLMQTSDGTGTVQFGYAANGEVAAIMYQTAGATVYYTYLPTGQLSEIRAVDKNGNILEDYTYLYDANGNIKQITNNAGSTPTSVSYSYDSLNQLTQETTWTGDTISYAYDKLGNRTSVTDSSTTATTNYSYDTEGNRLTSVGSNSVTYDANGQITGYGSTSYTWNAENELSQVTNGSQSDTYGYDPLGRRDNIDGYRIGYIGQTDLVGYVTDSNNNVVKRFVYNDAGLPILMDINISGTWHDYSYLYDGLGQIVGLIDNSTGQEVVTYTYDAWGNVIGHTDSTGLNLWNSNPFIYHGYWYDWDTGLYYLNARYYNPTIGRFLSKDPVAPQVGDALSYNEYAYTINNPITGIDPLGTRVMGVDGELGPNPFSWKPGDDIYAPTRNGSSPSDRTVNRRRWKNEAQNPSRDDYTENDLKRMQKGNPPTRYNEDIGRNESMELSHEPIPKRWGGTEMVPKWPQEHASSDPYRRLGPEYGDVAAEDVADAAGGEELIDLMATLLFFF